jgi:hypothetical protein
MPITTRTMGFMSIRTLIINRPDSFSTDDYATAFEYASSFLKQTEFMKRVDMTDEEILEWQKNNK